MDGGVTAYYWIATVIIFGAALFILELKKK